MQSVNDHIIFIGTDDDNLDLFEGQYPLTRGISYNSWLVEGDAAEGSPAACAIIDAVDRRRTEEWMRRLVTALRGRTPDYLIVQHMEPDHSGSIQVFLDRYPSARIIGTAKTAEMLRAFFEDVDWTGRVVTVKEGETLALGSVTLRFISAPMIHWPEVMMTFDETHGVLFSADAFGSFAMSEATPDEAWPDDARRYYANIVGKYGTQVQTVMHKLKALTFHAIAPLHGPMLTGGHLSQAWTLYDLWSRYKPEEPEGVLVAYASIYGGTAEAALRIADMLTARGVRTVVPLDLCRHDVSEAVGQAFRLGRMVLAAATYDLNLYPPMYNFLHHLEMKNFRGRRVAVIENGSWSPQAGRIMTEMLAKMLGMTIVEPRLTIRSRLHRADHAILEAIADAITA